LKGLEIRSQGGRAVIRDHFTIQPYSFGVIAGRETELSDRNLPIYRYDSAIAGGRSGYAEIFYDGREIAKATYEQHEPGRSLELDRVASAFDGYTSMSNLQPSATRESGSVHASPGRAGQTERMFIKEISGEGWHLVNGPGLLDTRMSRLARLNVLPLREEAVGFNDYLSREPVIGLSWKPANRSGKNLFR
jgi:hypothetical protein